MQRSCIAPWFLILALVLPVCPGGADEQKDSPQQIGGLTFIDQIELTIANIVIYVTDKKGNAVTNLTREDFKIQQDGEPKNITNFKLYTDEIIRDQIDETMTVSRLGPTPTPSSAAESPSGPVPVHLVLYIDNENLEPLDRNRTLRQTQEFIRNSLHPPAQMMVVSYQRSFTVLQEFTSDPSDVLAAMRSVRRTTGGSSERHNARKDIIDRIRSIKQQDPQNPAYDQQGVEWNEVSYLVDNYAKETANNLMFTIENLRHVITTLSGLPGKKGVIYVSNGLPMLPGMELFYELNSISPDSSVLNRMYEYDRSRLFQQLANAANAQDVTLYTISAAGLDMGDMGSAEYSSPQDSLAASVGRHNYNDSLKFLADETGGIAIVDTNDVSLRLGKITQDMFTYYSLGYPLQASGRDKVHKVKVSLPNHPDYELRYRSRFVEKSIETRVQDTVVSSLVFEVDKNPLQIDITTGTPSPASEKRWLLPTHISFPLNTVALLPEGDDYIGRVVVFIAVRDSEGKRSDLVRQNHEVRIPAVDYERAQRQRFGIDTQLLMESGRYRIAVAMLDQTTNQDSYQTIATSVHPEK